MMAPTLASAHPVMRIGAALAEIKARLDDINRALGELPVWAGRVDGQDLGEVAVELRDIVNRGEAASADVIRHFDRSRAWARDGFLDVESWLRARCKLSGGAAAERVGIGRQLEHLPRIQAAFANGEIGYQHAAVLARTAEHVGVAAVRREEAALLVKAQSSDAGQFVGVARDFEHRVDHEAALRETNHAYRRRYFNISEPQGGMVRLDGILDLEGGAALKTTLNALMPPPSKGDDRTPGQRRADALVELARKPLDGSKLGSTGGQRPHLVITVSAETLAGEPGAPAANLEGVGPIAIETAQRLACDSSISWLLSEAEREYESSQAYRRIPPSTRRALVARDRGCVFPDCQRPADSCEGHHVVWWTGGGKSELQNLALLCSRHHRMVHEEGWTMAWKDNRWRCSAPTRQERAPVLERRQ